MQLNRLTKTIASSAHSGTRKTVNANTISGMLSVTNKMQDLVMARHCTVPYRFHSQERQKSKFKKNPKFHFVRY